MTTAQKLILIIGLGIVGVAIVLRLRSLSASDTNALFDDTSDNSDTGGDVVNAIGATAQRIWSAIPMTPYLSLLQSTESALGIPQTLLTRMAWIESRFNPNAKSPAGAVGIMQIVPSQHPTVNASNPQAAIPYAGQYLKQLYNKFGSWEKAIAAYNWGEGHLQTDIASLGANWKAGLPAETSNYLAQVNQVIDLPA